MRDVIKSYREAVGRMTMGLPDLTRLASIPDVKAQTFIDLACSILAIAGKRLQESFTIFYGGQLIDCADRQNTS